QVNESMSDRARDYQAQVTGAPKGSAYRVKRGDEEVDFDGYDPEENLLLEAKGPGYEKFFGTDLKAKEFFKKENALVDQAQRQLRVSGGMRVRWVVAEEKFADALRALFRRRNVRVEVRSLAPNQ
ncbi:Tox-REase-5 domain-containing protein, partial [Corallococcus sp. AS-1-6]|uniref:Tox-REase-5 domain-containing protein n=1 Tax=Corallococcus sp. AS-1-6 TaxID=2874599 RepID=UPI001CBD2C50